MYFSDSGILFIIIFVTVDAIKDDHDVIQTEDFNITKTECKTWPFIRKGGILLLHPYLLDKNYNIARAPNFPNTTDVQIILDLNDIDTLDDDSKSLTLTVNIGQVWQDTRMAIPKSCLHGDAEENNVVDDEVKDWSYLMADDIIGQIWIPPLRIPKLWSVGSRKLFHDNSLFILTKKLAKWYLYGTFTLVLKCDMNFMLYPFDVQHCILAQEVLPIYQVSPICLQWLSNDFSMNSKESVLKKEKGNNFNTDSSGNWEQTVVKIIPKTSNCSDKLEVMFKFRRYLTSYVMQTFLPSTLLVLGSLISLWVPADQVPARMTLAVTTTLTLMSMINFVFDSSPRTSYLKAIDIWLMPCFFTTFLVFSEYCLVLYLTKKSDWYDKMKVSDVKGSSSPESRLVTRMRLAFTVEKWSGIMLPAAFAIYAIVYALVVLNVKITQYDKEKFTLVSLKTDQED